MNHYPQSFTAPWRGTDAHIDVDRLTHKDEWVGTQLAFRLTPDGSLQQFIETGHGTPLNAAARVKRNRKQGANRP